MEDSRSDQCGFTGVRELADTCASRVCLSISKGRFPHGRGRRQIGKKRWKRRIMQVRTIKKHLSLGWLPDEAEVKTRTISRDRWEGIRTTKGSEYQGNVIIPNVGRGAVLPTATILASLLPRTCHRLLCESERFCDTPSPRFSAWFQFFRAALVVD